MLSHLFVSKILTQGAVDSRIVWVRLDRPVCPLFVVCVYVPNKYRKNPPCTTDVIGQLEHLLSNCKPTE